MLFIFKHHSRLEICGSFRQLFSPHWCLICAVPLGFIMKLTCLSPVQYWFIDTSNEAFKGGGTNWLKVNEIKVTLRIADQKALSRELGWYRISSKHFWHKHWDQMTSKHVEFHVSHTHCCQKWFFWISFPDFLK